MGRRQKEKNEHIEFISGFFSVICTLLSIGITMVYINYMNYALNDLKLLDRSRWGSLTIYLSGMLIFVIVFLALNFLFCWFKLYIKKEGFIANSIIKLWGGGVISLWSDFFNYFEQLDRIVYFVPLYGY